MPSATSDDTSGHRERVSERHWYVPAWLEDTVLPSFEVIDTRSAQGRLNPRPKTVTVADLVLFHGHGCDGLLRGTWAMRALADVAFPGQPFDRSDLVVVSKNSPCLGDLAAYLAGGRARFGTHRLDDTLGVGFKVQRLSNGEAWEVSGRDHCALPGQDIGGGEQCVVEESKDPRLVAMPASHRASLPPFGTRSN